jgi:acyl-CoA synthetase (AMP-forming)/AMP-acid ligase II
VTATVVDAGDGLALTVPALLRERAPRRGDHPLLICDDLVLSYTDAAARSAALAKGLLAAGAGSGTHVGLLYPNGPDFVVAWLAAARIGAVAIPFSTFSTSAELRTLLLGADIELLLSTTTFRGRNYCTAIADAVSGLDFAVPPPLLDPATPALRRVAFAAPPGDDERPVAPEWTVGALLAADAAFDDDFLGAAESHVRPSDRMVIVHTSGSTSAPKGVIHQHGPLIRHLDNLNELRGYGEHEVLFSNSPFFWIGGLRTACSARCWPAPRSSVRTRPTRRQRSICSNACGRPWSTGSRSRSHTWPRIRRSRAAI